MACIDVRVATHCNTDRREVRRIVSAIARALRDAGYSVTISNAYRNRREPGIRVYIRIHRRVGEKQPA